MQYCMWEDPVSGQARSKLQEEAAQSRLCRLSVNVSVSLVRSLPSSDCSIWQLGGLCSTKRYFLLVLTSSPCSNMQDSLATGYSSRVKIESHNNPLERYASVGIPFNVTDSLSMLVNTCLRRPCMTGTRTKRKDTCCITVASTIGFRILLTLCSHRTVHATRVFPNMR
jgi:hypothetical protein